MTVTPNIAREVGRLQAVLASLHDFDNAEMLPVVKSLLAPSDHEQCFVAAYYRTVANVRTLMTFKDASHFQAIAMLARAMFELDVDVRLIPYDGKAIEKIYAFRDYERLRVARDAVALASAGKTTNDVSIQRPSLAITRRRLTRSAKRFGQTLNDQPIGRSWGCVIVRRRSELLSRKHTNSCTRS